MRVIVTGGGSGGHIYPAIAIADKIKEKEPDAEILYMGNDLGLEKDIVPGTGYPLELVTARWLDRKSVIELALTGMVTARGVLQALPLYYNRIMPYPCDIERYRDYQAVVCDNENAYKNYEKMDITYMRDALQGAVDFVKSHPDKILWCGEFGTIRHADIKWRENWMRDVITILKENDIPYCVWNYLSTPNDGNRFSLVDDDNRKILSEEMARIIKGEI